MPCLPVAFHGWQFVILAEVANFAMLRRHVGRARADTLVGDAQYNILMGFGGTDALDGAAGSDVLIGGARVDTLRGGLGNDIFQFATPGEGGDLILDFHAVAGDDDAIRVSASGFGGGLVAGVLAASQFQSRADNLAQDATDRFIFRTTDATLWFDVDGTGVASSVLIADLQAGAILTAPDILIF